MLPFLPTSLPLSQPSWGPDCVSGTPKPQGPGWEPSLGFHRGGGQHPSKPEQSLNGVRGNGEGGGREEVGSGGTGCSGAHLSCPERPGCLPELGSLFQPREGGCWALRVYSIPPSPAQL